MGTNYYVRVPCENACEHCNGTKDVHLGKSSAGWAFTFRGNPDWDYTDSNIGRLEPLGAWINLALSGPIRTEAGTPLEFRDLVEIIWYKANGQKHALEYPSEHDHFYRGHSFTTREFF